MSNLSVLVTTPRLDSPGGVSELMRLLALNQSQDIDYFEVQSGGTFLKKVLFFTLIIPQFIVKILKKDCIHFNPSMNANSFWRDGFLLIIAKILSKRTVVYWHGWDKKFSAKLYKIRLLNYFFKLSFQRSSATLVLGQVFKDELVSLGVDDSTIQIIGNAAAIPDVSLRTRELDPLRVLFLSRIEPGKGLDLVIRTIAELQLILPVHLSVAGDGTLMDQMKSLSKEMLLNDVRFHGHVKGKEKTELLLNSHLLFQPSSSEGMPLSMIESMFFELLIAAKPVGGIPDWVSQDHAILLNHDDPKLWANAIASRFHDKTKWEEDVVFQCRFAHQHLSPASLRERLFTIYQL
ncbi:MAG: hypothetical protein RLY35_1665 [Bacteroidota bacterium]|jgi:glycosyltransferase involved in cell wall biosynthesis